MNGRTISAYCFMHPDWRVGMRAVPSVLGYRFAWKCFHCGATNSRTGIRQRLEARGDLVARKARRS